jgi:hypothetical protein
MTDNTMTDNTVTEEVIKARVALGPLNRWWPVAASWMVTDTPLGLTRLRGKDRPLARQGRLGPLR